MVSSNWTMKGSPVAPAALIPNPSGSESSGEHSQKMQMVVVVELAEVVELVVVVQEVMNNVVVKQQLMIMMEE